MVFHIAICEDQAVMSDLLAAQVSRWADDRGITLALSRYPNAESFLFAYPEDSDFDLLLLDVEMGGMNGIALAKELRARKDDVQILFITGFPDYMPEGYDVAALHYLLKPVSEEKLFAVLDRALAANQRAEQVILCPTEQGKVRIPVREILYAEAFLHTTEIHTERTTYRAALSISELEAIFGQEAVRCHRSYLVLLRHVLQLSRTELTLSDHSTLPISRSAAAQVHAAFVRYYKGETS